MIREHDRALKARWRERFGALSPESRAALADALSDLRADARARSDHSWRANKPATAFYWRVVSIYAGHLARAVRRAGHGPCAEAGVCE